MGRSGPLITGVLDHSGLGSDNSSGAAAAPVELHRHIVGFGPATILVSAPRLRWTLACPCVNAMPPEANGAFCAAGSREYGTPSGQHMRSAINSDLSSSNLTSKTSSPMRRRALAPVGL